MLTSPFPKNNTSVISTNTKNILKLNKPRKLNRNSFDLSRSLRRFGKQSLPQDQQSDSLTKKNSTYNCKSNDKNI